LLHALFAQTTKEEDRKTQAKKEDASEPPQEESLINSENLSSI
jgi:hypothetical protein